MALYTLDYINDIIFNGFNYNISDNVTDIISSLSQEVGAPNYTKTPVFTKKISETLETHTYDKKRKKKSNSYSNSKNNCQFTSNSNNNTNYNKNNEWARLPTLKNTVFEKSTGSQYDMEQIRLQLNKLTDKNFMDIISKIHDILQNSTLDDPLFVGNTIFSLASNNRFYSNIYAQVYSNLLSKFTFMTDALEVNTSSYLSTFETIKTVDPNVDYDAFCDNNKMNENRKALTCFFVNLMIQNIIEPSVINNFITILVTKFYNSISSDGMKEEANEICENICILIDKEINPNLTLSDLPFEQNENIEKFLLFVAKSKTSVFKSLTNKTKFKLMDILNC